MAYPYSCVHILLHPSWALPPAMHLAQRTRWAAFLAPTWGRMLPLASLATIYRPFQKTGGPFYRRMLPTISVVLGSWAGSATTASSPHVGRVHCQRSHRSPACAAEPAALSGNLQEPGLGLYPHLQDLLQSCRGQTFPGSCNSLVMSSPYFMPCSGFHSSLGLGWWPHCHAMISFVPSKLSMIAIVQELADSVLLLIIWD